MDRGLDYHTLVEFIRGTSIRNVILLPNTTESFERIFNEAPHAQVLMPVENMEIAVKTAYQVTAEGHTCLLSPAAASYNSYKNFEERGNDFCRLVQQYGSI
jgi:UDP-N-acetylmuramoylalanine--D-glutamate ligase